METQAKSWTTRIAKRLARSKKRPGDSSSAQGSGSGPGPDPGPEAQSPSAQRPLSTTQHTLAQPTRNHDDANELGERDYGFFTTSDSPTFNDHTELIHGLSNRDSLDSLVGNDLEHGQLNHHDPRMVAMRRRREAQISSMPDVIWETVAMYLSPANRAHLALASKTLLEKVGYRSLTALDLPENLVEKVKFLHHLDCHLPDHLLCFLCARYHRRLQPGLEKLPTPNCPNPVVFCPASTASAMPRTRLTHSRWLPYTFVQLAMRGARSGPAHGLPTERLTRAWRESGEGGDPQWRHSTRYLVRDGHLLLRVQSHAFAGPGLPPAGMRRLLYEREEYLPYFSVCAHWADGELMDVCKCALSHVPDTRPTSVTAQLRRGPHAVASSLVHSGKSSARECAFCQSARRCPRCPSEYLVKINMVEDPADKLERFKYAIVVTRWVDLGDGTLGPVIGSEWEAVNGTFGDYDSVNRVGRRALMGVFESAVSGVIPGAGLVNMNPKNRTGGIDGD